MACFHNLSIKAVTFPSRTRGVPRMDFGIDLAGNLNMRADPRNYNVASKRAGAKEKQIKKKTAKDQRKLAKISIKSKKNTGT